MKRKSLIIGVLIALLSIGIISEANAHRWGCRRGYGYGYGYRPRRVWVAPPPPPPVAYYGYARPRYYRAPRYYARPHYGYRRW